MASMYLYPPIVDSSMPAFSSDNGCKIYYSLSKYNSTTDIKSIQISVVYQRSGINAVMKTDSNERYRSSGIIIANTAPTLVEGENNLYSISINENDIKGGWTKGEIYKVQLRFSAVEFPKDGSVAAEKWLSENANNFSEWSTICAIKPIGKVFIDIPIFDYSNAENENTINETTEKTLFTSTLDFHGTYSSESLNEALYSYRVVLYNNDYRVLEDSGILYSNEYYDANQFKYLFATELENGEKYHLRFSFTTEHGYEETLDDFSFVASVFLSTQPDFSIITVDNDFNNLLADFSSLELEEEEGRLGIKIFTAQEMEYSGNLCIRRTDSRSNFTRWEDIKIITFKNEFVNEKDIFFDYTIESGVWYKYGLQELTISSTGELQRSEMYVISEPVIRNFNYSYLLGENGTQLKLKYNNNMNSYKINVNESKTDTIGGMYPFITRTGNSNYRTIPITGLISFNMDDMYTFATQKEIYQDPSEANKIIGYYKSYNLKNDISQYDYFYERFFREKVFDFLHNGKPKLFKSTTEGNMIVRLMDISAKPEESLGRLIYSFSATAHEIAEATLNNYEKYNFYNTGTAASDFSISELKIGQIIDDFAFGENICERILKKYDSQGKNYAGFNFKLGAIKYLRIEINSSPLRIKLVENGKSEYHVSGYELNYNGKKIIIYGNNNIYEFDSLITLTASDTLYFSTPDDKGDIQSVNATIDFVYEITKDIYESKQIKSQTLSNGIGQYYEATLANTSIYNIIYYKYYTEWKNKFSRLSKLSSIDIEAAPGAVFQIIDKHDTIGEYHDIGPSGVLNLSNLSEIKELKFSGFRQPDGSIKDNVTSDILVNYNYVLTKGEYTNGS